MGKLEKAAEKDFLGSREKKKNTDPNELAKKIQGILEELNNSLPELPSSNHRMIAAGKFARSMWRVRRRREQFMGQDIFADPAWDMLLDLFASAREGKKISVSSLCVASGVPASTALRWITTLENYGMIERSPDASDKRRQFVALTPAADAKMAAFISWWQSHLASES